jgi:hypothetical protein
MKPNFAILVIPVFLVLLLASEAFGDMIPTDEIITSAKHSDKKQIVLTSIQRAEVRDLLLEHGADPDLVEQRLNQLTDEELDLLARQFEQLPAAGASNLDVILIGSGIIVLLLELTGVIDLTTAF